jgi:hypothetical protein
MTNEQLLAEIHQDKMMAVILNTADCPNYLVGAEDMAGNFHYWQSNSDESVIKTKSLSDAKAYLKSQGINEALFETTSAYDEMVGNAPSAPNRVLMKTE